MRIGQRPQLVLVMLRRLMIGRLPDFDREQVIGNLPLMHDDVRINRFSEMIVGGDDRSLRKPQRALPQPVVVAIDVPSRKLLFEVHRQAVGERALAEILFQQMGLARVEVMKRSYNLVQLGLHVASGKDSLASLFSSWPGFVPAIHVFLAKVWRPGTSSAKTRFALLPGPDECRKPRAMIRPSPSHLHFDQPRSPFGNGFRQRLVAVVGIADRAPGNAHAP